MRCVAHRALAIAFGIENWRQYHCRKNELSLECNVPSHRVEKRTQHKAKGFGVVDFSAVADPEKALANFFGGTFIVHMLGFEPQNGRAARWQNIALPLEYWENNLFLVAVAFTKQRQKPTCDMNAIKPAYTIGEAICD